MGGTGLLSAIVESQGYGWKAINLVSLFDYNRAKLT